MNANVGATDKIVRIVAGLLLAVAGFLLTGTLLKVLLFVAAAIALVTAAVSFCPLYKVLGINTCAKA